MSENIKDLFEDNFIEQWLNYLFEEKQLEEPSSEELTLDILSKTKNNLADINDDKQKKEFIVKTLNKCLDERVYFTSKQNKFTFEEYKVQKNTHPYLHRITTSTEQSIGRFYRLEESEEITKIDLLKINSLRDFDKLDKDAVNLNPAIEININNKYLTLQFFKYFANEHFNLKVEDEYTNSESNDEIRTDIIEGILTTTNRFAPDYFNELLRQFYDALIDTYELVFINAEKPTALDNLKNKYKYENELNKLKEKVLKPKEKFFKRIVRDYRKNIKEGKKTTIEKQDINIEEIIDEYDRIYHKISDLKNNFYKQTKEFWDWVNDLNDKHEKDIMNIISSFEEDNKQLNLEFNYDKVPKYHEERHLTCIYLIKTKNIDMRVEPLYENIRKEKIKKEQREKYLINNH